MSVTATFAEQILLNTSIGSYLTYILDVSGNPAGQSIDTLTIPAGTVLEFSSAVTNAAIGSTAVVRVNNFNFIGKSGTTYSVVNSGDKAKVFNTLGNLQVDMLGYMTTSSISVGHFVVLRYNDTYYQGLINVSNGQSTPVFTYSVSPPSTGTLGYYVLSFTRQGTATFNAHSTRFPTEITDIVKGGRVPSPDPYSEIPPTGPGGGDKPYDPFPTDDIDYELLPEVSAVGTGFVSLWCPTEQQMLNLSAYMWNADVLTLDFWRKLVADPIQLVYGLNIIPLDLRAKGIVGDTPDTVVVGAISTGIKMDYLTSQWVELDCGTIDIDESMLGSYLDYDPFTKVDIYLPYIGYRPLRIDDLMPGTIHLKYRIDLLTGSCVAQIKSTKSNEHDDTLNSIVYQYMGNCATQIPVTASQYADAVRSAITTAAAVGTIAVLAGTGAGAGVAAAGAEIMPGTQPAGLLGGPGMVPVDSELGVSMARYSQMTSVPSVAESGGGASTLKQAGIIHSAASAGGNVMGIKPSIERSGAIGGAAGMLATQIPYLVFTRPRIAHPEDQSKYTGYPSFMTRELSELSGFTQIQAIHLEGMACTANELAEIDALLKSGVIF